MLYFGLKNFTNHNIYQKVPNLVGVQLSDVTKIMDREGLRFEVIDSARFVPSMKPFSVLSQIPMADHEVKQNRKIYLIVNPLDIENYCSKPYSNNQEKRRILVKVNRI